MFLKLALHLLARVRLGPPVCLQGLSVTHFQQVQRQSESINWQMGVMCCQQVQYHR